MSLAAEVGVFILYANSVYVRRRPPFIRCSGTGLVLLLVPSGFSSLLGICSCREKGGKVGTFDWATRPRTLGSSRTSVKYKRTDRYEVCKQIPLRRVGNQM
jgi:hypothetical protein